ncbi:hypothetical protein WDW86_21710 [Bdellovibrionota bacterium FG-2]
MKLGIRKSKVLEAIGIISGLKRTYDTPMARFLTDVKGWVIEVEHLEQTGSEDRLRALMAAGKKVPDGLLEYSVGARTGAKKRKQYHVAEFDQSTYAVKVNVRDKEAKNVFKFD